LGIETRGLESGTGEDAKRGTRSKFVVDRAGSDPAILVFLWKVQCE